MNHTIERRAAILLAVAGLWMIVRYGLIPPTIGWPHWVHHLLTIPLAWLLTTALWLLAPGGRLYRGAAILFGIWAVSETFIGAAAAVWEGILGRGAIPAGVHAVELALYLAYVAALLLGIALIRRRGVPRWAGAALVAALLVDIAGVPWAAGVGIVAAAAGILTAANQATLGAKPVTSATP